MSSKMYSSNILSNARNYRVAPEVTSAAVDEFFIALDCPRALTAYMLFKYQEHEQLANLVCDPLDYRNMAEFRDAYAATKFLSKYGDLSLDYDLDKVALEKFKKFESLCARTNSRFRNLATDPQFKGPIVWLHNATIRKISKILGEFDFEELISSANWGPGATTTIKSRDASPANKFQHEAGITRDLHSLFPLEVLRGVYPLWASQLSDVGYPNFQIGNKVVTVPKDATTNRVIAIEPGINLWFQKAIGDMIGRRLSRFGIDLRRQSVNQNLARVGSLDSSLATIDLSSASDSISKKVVEELMPPRWHALLDSARSRFGLLDGAQFEWNKFSSMGNGFTFQLESLIFYAAADSCREYLQLPSHSPVSKEVVNGITHVCRTSDRHADQVVSVYGDDIIIPSKCLALFSALIEFYGFTINMKKTHFSSPFRESCGAHFYAGIDVKPIYFKNRLSDVLSVYRMANAIRRLAHRRAGMLGCDLAFRKVFGLLMNSVPKSLRLRIPETLGDGGFIANLDEASPQRARHCIEGYFVSHLVGVAKSYKSDQIGVLLSRLWVQSMKEEGNDIPLRDRVKLRFISRTLIQQWPNLGPWV